MFAAIQWDNPLPWEMKNSASLSKDQISNHHSSQGTLDQLGPISLRKVAAGRLGSNNNSSGNNNNSNSNFNASSIPSKVYGMNSNLINRALVPSAEQMMSDEMIGSSASRYAAIKEKRAGYFIDTSQDSVGIKDLSSKNEEKNLLNQQQQQQQQSQYSTPSSPESGSRSLTRRNSANVSLSFSSNILMILFLFFFCVLAWTFRNSFFFNSIC